MKKGFVVICLLVCFASNAHAGFCDHDYNEYSGNINILDLLDLPYSDSKDYYATCEKDEYGAPIYDNDGKPAIHPVWLAELGFGIIYKYLRTNNEEDLAPAAIIKDILKTNSILVNTACSDPKEVTQARLYYYDFAFSLHGNDKDQMIPPWYSSMAQGQVLSFFCLMYEITGDDEYRSLAAETMNSFLLFYDISDPWVSLVENNELWLEEYPHEPPTHVLNGFIFSAFGIYDYYRLFQSPLSESLLRGSISTLHNHVYDYRVKNHYSLYCLGHQYPSGKTYHQVHIDILRKLYQITDDEVFNKAADDFQSDIDNYIPIKLKGGGGGGGCFIGAIAL